MSVWSSKNGGFSFTDGGVGESLPAMPTRYRLPNGLTVVFEPSHASRVAAFQVWVKVGSADELPNEVGLAHLHEHMLFKGTAKRGLGEIARSVEAHGGEINAWTSFDHTVYHVVMASQYAEQGLDVLADAIRHSAFDAGELGREIEVVCEEIKRSLDMPARRASKELFSRAFTTHPYGRPVIGFEENVRAHSRDRVLAFYEKHYRPENMVLAAAGDFEEAQLREWVDRLFGQDWGRPPRTTGPKTRLPEPPMTGVTTKLTPDEVKEAYLHLAFHIPGVAHEDTPALDVLAMLVGQGDASRLSFEVRRKRGLAKEVSAWAYTPQDPGIFGATLVAPAAQLGEAFDETLRVLATMTAVEVDPDELETIKALIEAEAVYHREAVQGVARKLGYYEAAAGGIEREAQYYEAISKVTPAKLREVAQRYLTFDQATVTGLLPADAKFDDASVRSALQRAAAHRPAPLPLRKLAPSTTIRLSASSKAAKPGLTIERLPSGATIIVREERAAPLFALRGAFLGGLRYEKPEENGVTALLTRTLARGTTTMDAEQISHLTDSLAGSVSAVAGRSSVTVRGEFLSKHFERGFDLFADVATSPSFVESEFRREQKLILQDLLAREDRPSSIAYELLAKSLYQVHPYRMSTIGERATVEALTPDVLRRYHREYLNPSQMMLAVVGDVDTERVLDKARQAFGAPRPGAAPAPAVPTEPAWSGPREARKTLNKAQTHLMLGFMGARISDPWRHTLEVMATLLSGQSGRLFLELRDKRSMAYSVSAVTVEGVDPGYFAIYMATSPEKVTDAIAGIRTELSKLRETRVSDAELGRARENLIGSHEIGLQRNTARAGVMALDTLYGLGTEHWREYPDEISKVTAEDVREVAQRVIDFERSSLVVVGP